MINTKRTIYLALLVVTSQAILKEKLASGKEMEPPILFGQHQLTHYL